MNSAPELSPDHAATLIPSDLFNSNRADPPTSERLGQLTPSDNSESNRANPPTSQRSAHSSSINFAHDSGPNVNRHLSTLTRRLRHPCYEDFKENVQALWKSLEPLQFWKKASKRTSFLDSPLGRFFRSNKVLGLPFRRWNPESPECETQQMRGGSYNRVIGLTIPESYKTAFDIDRKFILRIPRDYDARLDRDVATLEYVRNTSEIPVPEVIHKDFTSNNPLGFPYMIQKRIPGQPLSRLWDGLNVEQRCSVAVDIAQTLRKLQALTSKYPGVIESHEEFKYVRRTKTVPYDLRTYDGAVEGLKVKYPDFGSKTSTLDLILYQINRWTGLQLATPAEERTQRWGRTLENLDELHAAALEMDRMGLLESNTFSLCHLDLQLRNIMGEIQDEKTVKVTGYLDWDSAVVAPSFVGCAPPFFLWTQGHPEDEYDERGASVRPINPTDMKVKQAFEDSVGREFLRYAYEPRFRLARMLFRVVKEGILDHLYQVEGRRFLNDMYYMGRLLLSREAAEERYG